jgi:hypothetical protein
MKRSIKPNASEIDKEKSISKLKRNNTVSKHKTVIKYKGGIDPKRANKRDIKSNDGAAIKVDVILLVIDPLEQLLIL